MALSKNKFGFINPNLFAMIQNPDLLQLASFTSSNDCKQIFHSNIFRMKTNTMKAIVAIGYGSPDVLKLQEVVMPKPKDREVLVKVYASSATTADHMMRTGKPYFGRLFIGLSKPKHPIPGTGFAGEVVAVGKDVIAYKVGERVMGETTLGFSTNAEYVAVPENGVILPMPESMGYAEAATFCDGPLTSMNFLHQIARIKPGQKVLINGASGSLGTAAIQLAKYFGAEVTGVCSSRNIKLVKSLGADHVIDYTQGKVIKENQSYDIIYDTVGKLTFTDCKGALSKSALFISPVLQFSLLLKMIGTSFFSNKKAKFAATGAKSDKALRVMLAELLKIYEDGHLKTIIDRQYPLEKLHVAHQYIASGHKKGNVVIVMDS